MNVDVIVIVIVWATTVIVAALVTGNDIVGVIGCHGRAGVDRFRVASKLGPVGFRADCGECAKVPGAITIRVSFLFT